MSRPRIAITMGDPAGVGPEISLMLLRQPHVMQACVPIIVGDLDVLKRVSQLTGLDVPTNVIPAESAGESLRTCAEPSVLDLKAIAAEQVRPGHVDAATGRAAYQYITKSIELASNAQVAAVATGPVHKEALHAAGIPFPGHTEIFAAQTGSPRACMMLTSQLITCSFVTTHVGYDRVPGLLSRERILEVIELSASAMRRLRGREPKLLVCGLNPHAGEHGLFGNGEEERIIEPAVRAAQAEGIDVTGPLPPDTVFLPARRAETDCFVCMYHDQGHIPLKALAFDLAVNITLGLPMIRTSVDHGTACDIAWMGKADVSSLVQATLLAARLV
jgi:4-hydroxythreonine-4-phosphate dehydrogenase